MDRLHSLALQTFSKLPTGGRRFVIRRLSPSFTVGAMCFVRRDDGRFLLIRHTYRGPWGVPGGLLERGETAEAAAIRETREETGLTIEIVEPPTVVVEPDARRVDVIFHCRPAEAADPDALDTTGSAEVHEAAWFATDELPEIQPEIAAGLERLLAALESRGA